MFTATRRPLRLRAGLVLVACLAVVAAMLSLGGAPARADTCGTVAPWSIVVTGPSGQSTTQPPYANVHLAAVDAAGRPVCSASGLRLSWSVPAFTPPDQGNYAWVNADGDGETTGTLEAGTITYQVLGYVGAIQEFAAQVTVTYSDDADPGPSGTILTASPSGPSVGQPTTLTAATTSPLGGTYDWAFGDGGTASSSGTPAVTHVYRSAGDYIASVRVTDPLGKTDSATQTIHVSVPLAPAFSLSASTVGVGQAIDVDGSRSSTDPAATISGWSWDFGDGTHATGKTASYAYAATGTYTVTETVTDSLGRTATATRDVVVQDATTGGGTPPPAAGPHAAWTLATTSPVAGALTAFDGTGSTDDGGTIVSYAWAFGDGLTGAGASPRHVFADGGSYPVTLTVTDDSGHSSSATHLVSVGYAPPTAAFTTGPASPVAGQSVSFDAGGSSAPVPGPMSYAWSFGDGAQASGPTATHAFPAQGSYAVTLTVTDAGGRSASVTHVVTTTWGATDLAVSVGGSVPKAGRYTYRVTVKNLGAVGAHGVVLLSTLDPTQVLAVKASAPAGVSCGGVALGATGTISCRAGTAAVLAPGKSWVVTFTVRQPTASRARTVTETSVVSAANPDPVGTNNGATRSTTVAR